MFVAPIPILLAYLIANDPSSPVEDKKPRRPNILFLLSDDQRPDTIAALGNGVIRTPNLDSLIARGTVFTRAISPNPLCVPSRAEILTGCSGFRNGVLPGISNQLDATLPLWPQTLRRAGYRTVYVGKWHTAGRPSQRGYDESVGLYAGGGGRWAKAQVDHHGRPVTGYRGWVFQTDDGAKQPEHGVGLTPDISASFADAAIEVLRRRQDRPFFLHVNFTAPHDPLLMPPGADFPYAPDKISLPANFAPEHPFDHGNFRGRDELLLPWPRTPAMVKADLAVYYAVISHLDAQIGRILEVLHQTGQADNTIVLFSSDHGLAMGSHGLRGKQNMYEHTVGVPLVLRGPGIQQGARIDAQCYLRDLYPTTCDLAAVTIPASVEGHSLKPLLDGTSESVHPRVFGYFKDAQRMVRTDRWKLIHYLKRRRYQLFDLENDADERHDLAGSARHAEIENDLRARLRAWRIEVGDPTLDVAAPGANETRKTDV